MTMPPRTVRARQAEALLHGLLRTPKTRPGLVAAVSSHGVTRNFVYGWLAAHRSSGAVAQLKSMRTVMYQMSHHVVQEVPAEGRYPTWMEPRALPMVTHRRVFIDGKPIDERNDDKTDS